MANEKERFEKRIEAYKKEVRELHEEITALHQLLDCAAANRRKRFVERLLPALLHAELYESLLLGIALHVHVERHVAIPIAIVIMVAGAEKLLGNGDMLYFPEDGVPFGEYDTIRTKSFLNDGDVSVGLEITILAHDTVTNPIIYDQNGNYFGLVNITMQAGDNIVITTHKGNKSVKYNGNIIYDKIKPNSTWLQLEAGDNTFSIDSDDDSITNMSFSLTYRQRYI